MPHLTSQPIVNGDIVRIVRAKTGDVVNKRGSVVASDTNWIVVGAMRYTHVRATEFEHRDLGRCVVTVIEKAPPERPWAA